MSTHRVTLKAGTCVHVDGVPVELTVDTEVETASHELLLKHTHFEESYQFQ